jgi:hypothetical protein
MEPKPPAVPTPPSIIAAAGAKTAPPEVAVKSGPPWACSRRRQQRACGGQAGRPRSHRRVGTPPPPRPRVRGLRRAGGRAGSHQLSWVLPCKAGNTVRCSHLESVAHHVQPCILHRVLDVGLRLIGRQLRLHLARRQRLRAGHEPHLHGQQAQAGGVGGPQAQAATAARRHRRRRRPADTGGVSGRQARRPRRPAGTAAAQLAAGRRVPAPGVPPLLQPVPGWGTRGAVPPAAIPG